MSFPGCLKRRRASAAWVAGATAVMMGLALGGCTQPSYTQAQLTAGDVHRLPGMQECGDAPRVEAKPVEAEG